MEDVKANNGKDTQIRLTAKRKWVLSNWKQPATMRMIEARTKKNGKRVYNTTICGMMHFFLSNGLVRPINFDHCRISTHKAWYYQLTEKGKSLIVKGNL